MAEQPAGNLIAHAAAQEVLVRIVHRVMIPIYDTNPDELMRWLADDAAPLWKRAAQALYPPLSEAFVWAVRAGSDAPGPEVVQAAVDDTLLRVFELAAAAGIEGASDTDQLERARAKLAHMLEGEFPISARGGTAPINLQALTAPENTHVQ